MKKIDINWLKKFGNKLDKLSRTLPLNNDKYKGRCEKEIFTTRYFRFLKDKCFKIKIKDEVYFAMFAESKITQHSTNEENDGNVYYIHGITYALTYNSFEFRVTFFNEKLNNEDMFVKWNDVLRIKYEEITPERYWEVVKMFKFETKKVLI